jgi:hypothetical protein
MSTTPAPPGDATPAADVASSRSKPDKLTAPPAPRSLQIAIVAIIAQAVFTLVRAIGMFGYGDQLQRLLIKANKDLKHPKSNYTFGSSRVLDDLHSVRTNGLWQSIVIGIALVLLAYSLRRVSTASVTRWAILVVMVMTGGPFTVIPSKGLPVVPQVSLVLAGVSSLIAIVCLFLPDSRMYFREMSGRRRGELDAIAPGVARPSLRSLLSTRPSVSLEKPPAPDEPPVPARVSKAKRRSEAEAVARGAELARARAKASKTRRTES